MTIKLFKHSATLSVSFEAVVEYLNNLLLGRYVSSRPNNIQLDVVYAKGPKGKIMDLVDSYDWFLDRIYINERDETVAISVVSDTIGHIWVDNSWRILLSNFVRDLPDWVHISSIDVDFPGKEIKFRIRSNKEFHIVVNKKSPLQGTNTF